ncbi:hypothetical protein [Proteiniclasticum ruminis]|uniref:hypothetical protein n=1 Tax=Proteiniclasticum ruminis TaxID=398199 RepID=UPI0012DD2BCD|nr:hypothetical protein [Proteiniclasticum ruminis]
MTIAVNMQLWTAMPAFSKRERKGKSNDGTPPTRDCGGVRMGDKRDVGWGN